MDAIMNLSEVAQDLKRKRKTRRKRRRLVKKLAWR
jgi:hypothetical protein